MPLPASQNMLCFLQSSADQAGQQCSNQCKVTRSPYEGDPDQLSGSCGCTAPHHTCSPEFSSGIVKDLCDLLGNRELATASIDSSTEVYEAAGGARRLQGSKVLSLLATAE